MGLEGGGGVGTWRREGGVQLRLNKTYGINSQELH